MNEKKMQLLRDFDWERYIPDLFAFTEWLIQGYQWNFGTLPGGHTAESIVQEVLTKTLSEKRDWDPDRGELITWIKYVIRSDINHLAESKANKVEVPYDLVEDDDVSKSEKNSKQYLPLSSKPYTESPEDLVISREIEDENNRITRIKLSALLDACSGKSELEEIVYSIIEGKCDAKPKELANFLDKPINRINQSLRALRRRAITIINEDKYGKE